MVAANTSGWSYTKLWQEKYFHIKIAEFTDFDNKNVTFSDPTGNADIRTAGTMNAHVWFPANKEAKLIIEGIDISGFKNVKLSYDFTHRYMLIK